MQKIIDDFKDALIRPVSELIACNMPIEMSVFVFKNDNIQFVTNNRALCSVMSQKMNFEPKIMDINDVKFNSSLRNCLFVEDETVDSYWLHGMIDNCLAIMLTDKPEELKTLLDTMIDRHFSEFKAIYNGEVLSDQTKFPKMRINARVDGKILFKDTNDYVTESDIRNCQRYIKERIDDKTQEPISPNLPNTIKRH